MGFFGKLFGSEKKDQSYQGARPIMSLSELPMGRTLSDLLMQRMQGQGVGFGNDYVSRTTNPSIQARMNRWQDYEMPQLSSQLSARGMARSTLAGDLIRRSAGEREQDISQLLANAYQQNEMQKRQEIQNALSQGQGYLGMEAGQQNAGRAADYQNYLGQIGLADQQRQRSAQGWQNMIGAGANMAMMAIPGMQGVGIANMMAQSQKPKSQYFNPQDSSMSGYGAGYPSWSPY
jgi:hypothetical protein